MKHRLYLIYSIALLCCLTTHLPSAYATQLNGRVAKTINKQVEIELQGDLLPQVGDPVTIGFTLPEVGFIALDGKWRVSSVNLTQIIATPEGATRQPQKNQLVQIQSLHPQQRQDLEPPKQTPQTVQPPVGQSKADHAMWRLVADSTEIKDVEHYLTTFPRGKHITEAKLKHEQLKQSQQQPKPKKKKREVSQDLEQYLVMVESGDYQQKYKGAKYIYKKRYGQNIVTLQVLSHVLTEESQRNNLSKQEAKILIYICKLIALSKNGAYVQVLDQIATTTPNQALKKYAIKYTAYLQKTTGLSR